MSEEQSKTKKFVLPKEARLMMVNFLESQNIVDVDAMDDEKILKEYNACTLKMQEKVNNYEMSAETKNINQYVSSNSNLRLADKEFIMRLFKLNIPSFYLHLFKDDDKVLDDRELWRIVNKSGINPVDEIAKLTKMRRSIVGAKAI